MFYEPMNMRAYALPHAGIDSVQVKMTETYEVEGVGRDTVELSGTLVARRAAPLLVPGESRISWETATIVSEFTELTLEGESDLFGPVRVTLDDSQPSFGAVQAGRCAAVVSVRVEFPKLGMNLRTAEPLQLTSQVSNVPPIGDERTVSVHSVGLVDGSGRSVGRLHDARVMWRELTEQTAFAKVVSPQ